MKEFFFLSDLKNNIYRISTILIVFCIFINNCSPINKQHGYLIDDFVLSSDSISNFSDGITNKSTIFEAMGSPSIEILDVSDVWIYLVSVKEKKVFDKDEIQFQNIYRFEFDKNSILTSSALITKENSNAITFSSEKTRVIRDAYGITDQLYEAFTRGQ